MSWVQEMTHFLSASRTRLGALQSKDYAPCTSAFSASGPEQVSTREGRGYDEKRPGSRTGHCGQGHC